MSLFNTLRRALGVNAGDDLQDETQMNPFDQAGLTGDETTGTVTGATNVNTGALPQSVVDNATQTQTTIPTETTGAQAGTQTSTGTKPPPLATPGIVGGGNTFSPQFIAGGGGSPLVNVLNNQVVTKRNEKGQESKVLQDLIEIGGTGFDDEVLARKLRRQAALPELKNEDYYPNQPFTQAQTAWGDPIFSGAGALFPMAAYDAQIRARAQAEIDEAKRNVMQVKIPEVKTAAYYQKVRSDFTNEIMGATNEAVKRFGGNNQKAMQYLRQSGILAQIENKYNALAMNIDQFADEANAFLKGARENPDKIYSSLEGVKAANNFLAGMNAFNNGEITAEQLNGLRETFQTAERWSNYKKDALEKYADDEVSPGIMGDNLTPEEEAIFQRQLNLPDGFKDKRHFLVVKKYSEANEGKIKEAIVKPFFNENRTALEQLRVGNETEDQTIDRVSKELAALRGTKIYEDIISESESKGSNINVYGGGAPSKGTGIYHNTAVAKPKIKQYLSDNHRAVKEGKVSAKQALKQAYLIADASGSWQPDNEYMRVRIPGKWATIQQEVTPMPYSQMYVPDKNNPARFHPYDPKVATGNPNAGSAAQPSHTIIIDTERAWMIPSGNGYKMVSQKEYEDLGMPEGAESYRIDKVNAYRSEAELTQSGGMKDPQTGTWVIPPGVVKSGTRNLGKIAYQIYPENTESVMDLDARANRAFNAQSFGGGAPQSITVNVTNQEKQDF